MCKRTIYKTCNTRIDKCMRPLIKFLQEHGYRTVSCCCGHSKYPMTIIAKYQWNGIPTFVELLSGIVLTRSTKFYKRDSNGYFYIPEVSERV